MAEAVVIGGGIGGLAAAIHLAAAGVATTVLEAAPTVGGKAGTATVDGVSFDTGPSLLTIPSVFAELLAAAGSRLADEVELLRPDPAFRYVWPTGAVLDVHPELDATLAAVRRVFGGAAESELSDFLRYAERIWAAAAPRFVFGPAPTLTSLTSLGAIREIGAIDPWNSMAGAIARRVRDPHLQAILLRFGTYVGSDPRKAPATLNCIAHVELALGGHGVRGGVGALIDALGRAAAKVGVRVRCGERVTRIEVRRGRVVGVVTDGGPVPATLVVANGEPTHTLVDLCGGPPPPEPSSTSGFTAVLRAPRAARAAHTVWFPRDPEAELDDLFVHRRVPREPMVYACAQEVAHGVQGWDDGEPVFVMIGAPCLPVEADWAAVERSVVDVVARGAPVVWRRTPQDLAVRFPGSRGALYGAASHGMWSSFARPANRVPGIAGLYLASGGAHPGGGLPLCAASGRAAATAALEDLLP